jgi:rod shape-determining protein MreC
VAIKGLDNRWRVVLASDKAAVDYVRILLFQDFTQVVNRAGLEKVEVPPATPGASTLPPPVATPAAVLPATAPPTSPERPAARIAPRPAGATP